VPGAEIIEIRKGELLERAKLEIGRVGLGNFAAAVGIDPSNMSKIISGRRRAKRELLAIWVTATGDHPQEIILAT
jgi:hypothetical protein